MIRIDEIYNNTFWPYINKHVPMTRMFFCDPPGRSDPESLFNFGNDIAELNYIFFHDQEPIHFGLHDPLFQEVARRNEDLNYSKGAVNSAVITSEWDSDFVAKVQDIYGWKHYYYFYHGWAAMDWYRGYNRSFLMPEPEDRLITKSFISPNRIIGGYRAHRLLLMYHLVKSRVDNAWISFPACCPVEKETPLEIADRFVKNYPDIKQVMSEVHLPKCFPGENDHPMHSCWLSLFNETAQSMLYMVTETIYTGRRNHLTEKTFKPICMKIPFIILSTANSLEYLRRYGFKTFDFLWDESYDQETDDLVRIEKVANILAELDTLSIKELQQIYRHSLPVVEHNYQHFYGGNFEKILWQELSGMLESIKNDFRI